MGLGALPLVGPDEPRYAEVGREMWASGDWISPRLCGALWFEKPVLLYWGQVLGYSLFGANELGARFPSALGATLSVFGVFFGLWSAGLRRLGFLSALILASCAIWLGLARAAATDMPFSAALCGVFLCGWNALRPENPRRQRFAWGCAVFVGVAMLGKGLAGALLPFLAFSVFAWRQRHDQHPNWKSHHFALLAGTGLLAFGVAGAWYGPVLLRHGAVFYEEFFVRQQFSRFSSNLYHHRQPFYFFGIVALAGIFPWTFWLIAAIVNAVSPSQNRQRDENVVRASLRRFSWIWALVILGFFSLSQAKLPAYILPAFPALAILIALEIEKLARKGTSWWPVWATLGLLALATPLLVILARSRGAHLGAEVYGVALVPLLGALATLFGSRKSDWRVATAISALVLPLVAAGAGIWVFGHLTQRVSLKPLAVRVGQILRPGELVWYYKTDKQFAADFYTQGRVVTQNRSGDRSSAVSSAQLVGWLQNHPQAPGLVVLTRPKRLPELENDARLRVVAFDGQEKMLALRVTLNPQK